MADIMSQSCASGDPARSNANAEPSATLGLEWHYHAGVVALPLTGDHVAAAYANCRAKHTFLTDDNHTWSVTEPQDGHLQIVVRKNELSSYFVIKPWWVDDGPGALWFSDRYRIATEDTVRREWDRNVHWEARSLAEAEACQDTVRGRKAAKSARSSAYEAARLNRVLAKRWPDTVAALQNAHPTPIPETEATLSPPSSEGEG